MIKADVKPVPDMDTRRTALYWKAHTPPGGIDSIRAMRILQDMNAHFGIDSSDERFVIEVVGQWILVTAQGRQ